MRAAQLLTGHISNENNAKKKESVKKGRKGTAKRTRKNGSLSCNIDAK